MFGYVRPLVNDLTVGDYKYYKAVYCGICREMGKICGPSCRLTLSYDSVFLALVRTVIINEKTDVERKRCPVNPLLRRDMTNPCESLNYAATVSAMLASFKIRDNLTDEKGLKKAAAALASPFGEKWERKGSLRYAGLYEGLSERLNRFYETEKKLKNAQSDEPASDVLAALFGEVMSYVFSFGLENDKASFAVSSAVGKHIGRWIYITDAIDDMKKDNKSGNFNPLLISYGRAEFTEDEKFTLECLLGAESGGAAEALYLADISENCREAGRIVENILTKGMPATLRDVLNGKFKKEERHTRDVTEESL